MPCYTPKRAHRGADGRVIYGSPGHSSEETFELPCGQCIGCRLGYAEEWAVRIHHEASLHDENAFATFTYNDEELPDDGGLRPPDFTKMCKRLRAAGHRFRYFQCGEYGDETQRPHHHACLFGLSFRSGWEEHGRNKYGQPTFRSPELEEFWGHGNVIMGDLTWQSAAYVARYCLKKANGDDSHARCTRERYDLVTGEVTEYQVLPEYVTMSRGNRTDDPIWGRGIGNGWIKAYKSDVFPRDETIINGRRFKTPRYYVDQLPEDEKECVSKQRQAFAENYLENNTYMRRKVREQAAKLRARRAQRNKN